MKITFEGENVVEVANEMAIFLTQFGFAIAGQIAPQEPGNPEVDTDPETDQHSPNADPEETPPEDQAEDGEPVPEPEPDISPEDAKKQAIDILMEAYGDGKRDAVKELLAAFGVKKFGEVEDDKGPDLLKAAEELKAA